MYFVWSSFFLFSLFLSISHVYYAAVNSQFDDFSLYLCTVYVLTCITICLVRIVCYFWKSNFKNKERKQSEKLLNELHTPRLHVIHKCTNIKRMNKKCMYATKAQSLFKHSITHINTNIHLEYAICDLTGYFFYCCCCLLYFCCLILMLLCDYIGAPWIMFFFSLVLLHTVKSFCDQVFLCDRLLCFGFRFCLVLFANLQFS